ncbi:HIT family protein [Flavobacteriales bacterium]|nr:HIT family protein [Flavobacteriales bacterium]
MSSIFAKIIKGEIPCYKLAENNEFLAFLDIAPLAKGHALVIPKKETDYIFDMKSHEYARLWQFAMRVAVAQKKVISCKRIGVAVIGLEVPHAHIHLVPINGVEDINFSRPKLSFEVEEMRQVAQAIEKAF